jgi:hypothetical protein
LDGAFETVCIPFEKQREMLTVLRVNVFAHSNGTLKLQTNLGAILSICPKIKCSVSNQTVTGSLPKRAVIESSHTTGTQNIKGS